LNDRSKAIEQLICFNVGFDSSTEYDETREYHSSDSILERGTDSFLLTAIAQRTADFLGLPFVSTRLDEAAFAENFEQAFLHSEHHNPDLNSVAKFVLSGLAREHGMKVILSGIVFICLRNILSLY
jgi:asparagine synthase (glutamine-hydrolysing)